MKIRFWGVRGSLPTPDTPARIRGRIAAILERIGPADLESPQSRRRFLESLPSWVYGAVGGNTSCVSVSPGSGAPGEGIIFDAGSGIRELGLFLGKAEPKLLEYHLFFSHYHWDHIQGLPFFTPAYDPAVRIGFYSPLPGLEAALKGQMSPPFFPVGMEAMASGKEFHQMDAPLELRGLKLSFKKMNHPGGCYSYLVEEGGRRFLYATDTELSADDFARTEENARFFKDADLAVIDAQYTLEEAINKYNWGHNAFSMAVDFAANWKIRRLVLFHHEPAYDDKKLFAMFRAAREYQKKMSIGDLEITLALEGLEIAL